MQPPPQYISQPGQYPQFAQLQHGQPFMTNQGMMYNNRFSIL